MEFEAKDKLYTDIAEARKAKGKEPRYKVIEASRLQYQYTYVHDRLRALYINFLRVGSRRSMSPPEKSIMRLV